MSAMTSTSRPVSIRDALYEAPGPKTRAKIRVGTAITAVLVALLLGFVVYQFWATGQLNPRYWMFFTQLSTWSYLLAGLRGTLTVAPPAASRWFWASPSCSGARAASVRLKRSAVS